MTLFRRITAEGVQAGQVVANPQHADQDHRQLGGCLGQPHPGPRHHRLHLRGGGHAALRQELQGVRVQDPRRLQAAALAHARLLPLVPHRVPCAVRRVDRDHVGLHGGGRPERVPNRLHDGHGHRQPGGRSPVRWFLRW